MGVVLVEHGKSVGDFSVRPTGARRRRSGGVRDGGCARMPVAIPSPPRGGRWKPRSRDKPGTVGGYEGRQIDPQD
jgi:hypothetical protein